MLGSFPLVLCAFILVMRLHERRTVAAFQTAGAVSPEQGRRAGLYYVDAEVWKAVRGTRRRVLLALLLVFVATVVLYRTSWGR